MKAGEAVSPDEAAHLIGRIGRLLLVNGADTAHALARMDECAARLRCPVHRLATPEAVLVWARDGAAQRTRIGPAIPAMAVNMAALVAIERVLDNLRVQAPDVAAARRGLDAVERGGGGHADLVVVLGVAVTAGSLARLFGAGWPVVGAAFVAGVASTILRLAFARRRLNAVAAAFLTALLSGLVAEAAIRVVPGASPVFCLTAAGMILVPGVPLLNGVRDLVGGHAGNAVARLTLGATTVLAIGFALFAAAAIARDALPVGAAPGSPPVAQDLLFSGAAAAGYAMLFAVPWRGVIACVLCGMASHGLRTALGHLGIDIATASLIGAGAAGIVARIAARYYRVPAVTFAFPGIVAMIPGSYGFRAAIGGLHLMALGGAAPPGLVAETVSLAITTAVVTVAIGIGLTFALAIPPDRPHRPEGA